MQFTGGRHILEPEWRRRERRGERISYLDKKSFQLELESEIVRARRLIEQLGDATSGETSRDALVTLRNRLELAELELIALRKMGALAWPDAEPKAARIKQDLNEAAGHLERVLDD